MLFTSIARLNVDVQKLAQANKDGYEYLKKKHKEEVEANDKQIEALSKNIGKQKEQLQAYEKRAELIVRNGQLAKAELEDEYKLLEESLVKNEKYEERVLALRKERDEKIGVIAKDTLNKTIQNGADMQMALEVQSKASIDKVIEHAGEAVKHTSGAWKGVIDVGAQKEHLKEVDKQYVMYIYGLKDFGAKRLTEYSKQINEEKLSVDQRATLIAQRNAFEAKHNKFVEEESKRVGAELAKVEKASQNLRLQQWNEYVAKYQAVGKQIGEATAAAGNAFKQLSASHAQDVADITQKLADNETAKYEAGQEYEANKAEHEAQNIEKQKEIDAETIKMNESTTEEDKKLSQERIKILESEKVTKKTVEKEFDDKDTQLKNDKRKAEKKAKQAEKIQKKIELGQQIVTAIGDIAAGTAKAFSYGPILGPILATIVAAAGAMQVGIMTKQLAKFEDGGLLSGKRHSAGGMRIQGSNIEVEGGEYVVNKQSTDKNLGLISYINSQRRELAPNDLDSFFGKSAQAFNSPFQRFLAEDKQVSQMPRIATIDNEQLLDAIHSIKFEPKVSVTDINTVQADIVKVDAWVGM